MTVSVEPLNRLLQQEFAVKAMSEASKMSQLVSHFIGTIYGPEIDHLEGIEPEKKADVEKATTILKHFYTHALDFGLLESTQYHTPWAETHKTTPVAILRRSAFTDFMKNTIVENYGKPVNFIIFDIKNLRGADLIGAAEWMLHNVAAQFQDIAGQTQRQINQLTIQSCRFGGDEFALGIVGDITDTQLADIRTKIKAVIHALPGHYKEYDRDLTTLQKTNERIVSGNIDINDKTAKLPLDDYGQLIFLSHLRYGLILTEKEIDNIKISYPKKADFDKFMDRLSPSPIYPKDKMELDEKIAYLKQKHSELFLPLSLAESLDAMTRTDKRKIAILDFIEKVVYDPLFGEAYYSFADFQDHLAQGQIRTVYGFDMKYIKEINDQLNYVEGDLAIKVLSDQILTGINAEDRGKVILSRRGGSFMVGVRKGETLSSETIDKLDQLHTVKLFGDTGGSIEVPVGYAKVDINETDLQMEGDESKQAGNIIGQVMKKADRDWYLGLFDQITKLEGFKEVAFEDQKGWEDFPPEMQKQIILTELYFSGKRFEERFDRALQVFNEIKSTAEKEKKYYVFNYLGRIYRRRQKLTLPL